MIRDSGGAVAKSLERKQRRTDELLALLEGLAIEDATVSKDAMRALSVTPARLLELRELDDEQLAAAGWTRPQFETAWEARKPRSEAAYAVQLAHERTGMRIRQAAERAIGKTQVAALIILPTATAAPTESERKRAPVIDVGGEK